MKGYKVFNPDWTCRDFQYAVGETYKHNGEISVCRKGFHFVAEIEALGLVESDGDKSVTDEIRIVREIPWAELLEIVNTGKGNTGLSNSGNSNSGNRNSGYFSSITPKMTLFEKPTDLTAEEINEIKGVQILNWNYENNWWIYSENMTAEEKAAHPEHETLGGYLKVVSYKEACAMMWERLTADEKEAVKAIPNFDADIFERITGIKAV